MAPLNQDFDILTVSIHDVTQDIYENDHKQHKPLHECNHRNVSFGAVVETHEIISRSEYTLEELEASWFDADEMKQIKATARSEVKRLDAGDATVHSRGLECRTRAGSRQKKQSRINAYSSVFFELECQFDEQIYDEDLIADAYFEYTQSSAIAAHELAKQDAIEAIAVYSE